MRLIERFDQLQFAKTRLSAGSRIGAI